MATIQDVRCHKCDRDATQIQGYLKRISPLGEENGTFECRPSCDAKLTNEEAIIAAIEDADNLPSKVT